MATEKAPAKVNLSLHVLGRRDDGWHELESLVAFAGCSDTLTFSPGGKLRLSVEGPAAAGAGADEDNLVLRAARRLAQQAPDLRMGAFVLTKRLPAAAGLGGGSSDAAAALRLLARANALALDDPRVREAARASGADVPVCLERRARVMSGLGETLGPALALPPLYAVLANAGVGVETAKVFAQMSLTKGQASGRRAPAAAFAFDSSARLIESLRAAGNDMEPAANALAPIVGETLKVLAGASGALLTRMSGSGATCFALFDSRRAAVRAAVRIRAQKPAWWVRATLLR